MSQAHRTVAWQVPDWPESELEHLSTTRCSTGGHFASSPSSAVTKAREFTSKTLDEWAYHRGIKLDYTQPGKPTDNGLIESFNGRLRDEFLNVQEFVTLHDTVSNY